MSPIPHKTIAHLLFALAALACAQKEGSTPPALSAPEKTFTGAAAARPEAQVAVSSGPVRLSLELLTTRARIGESAVFFRAALQNLGASPRQVADALFTSPDEMLLGSSIYLEVIAPDGRRLEPVRRVGMGGTSTDEIPAEAQKMQMELGDGVHRAQALARKEGRDPDVASAAFTREFNVRHGLRETAVSRELAPGESITTPTWTYPYSPAKPVSGYAEMPFRFEQPGHYKVRLVHDYEFLSRLRRGGKIVVAPEALRLATDYITFDIVK